MELPAATRMGTVHLSVADLDRSVSWYEQQIGLRLRERADGVARLGVGGEDLLVLREEPGARPADGYSGLFHVAYLVPTRRDLASFLAHVARDRVPLVGLSDHFVSEAIYLRDPDHHGIEVYADRPRALWNGKVGARMTTVPLDTDDLLGLLDDPATDRFDGLAPGTSVGHVHLCVADVEEAVSFYRDVLGFGLMATYGSDAAFLAAGGYHHHVGANTWYSRGAPYAPLDRARLERMTVVVPDDAALGAVASLDGAERTSEGVALNDPAGNPLLVASAT